MAKMTLSEVFYEAACRISDMPGDFGDYSCHVVNVVEMGRLTSEKRSAEQEYAEMMTKYSWEVGQAADEVGWNRKDYRTFMLLMASEAVK